MYEKTEMVGLKELRVGFIWHNVSSGNLGVGALSISNMMLIDKVLHELGYDSIFFTFGDNEVSDKGNKEKSEFQMGKTFYHYNISVKKLVKNPMEMFNYIRKIRSMDLVFDIGAGDSFSDIYGYKRFFIQAFTKIISAFFAKVSILSPQTIGPFKSKAARAVSGFIMGKSDLVFVRDQISFDLGGKLASCYLSTDVALAMPYELSSKFSENSTQLHVGLNISGLLWRGGYTGGNQFGIAHSYRDFVTELIKSFENLREPPVIHLISHVIATNPYSNVEDDFAACEEVVSIFPNCVISPRFTNPIDAKNYIAKLDYFSGARMHATIAAFSSGVPVTPYAYSRKFRGLYETFGFQRVLEANSLSLADSVRRVLRDFERRDEIRAEVQKCQSRVRQLEDVYIQRIKELIYESIK